MEGVVELFVFQAEDGIRDAQESRGLGDVYKRQETAITREKQIKKWERAWKIRLIEKDNPDWADLYEKIVL